MRLENLANRIRQTVSGESGSRKGQTVSDLFTGPIEVAICGLKGIDAVLKSQSVTSSSPRGNHR